MNIFLDDERACPESFVPAYTTEAARWLLICNKGEIDTLSLDNDLGNGYKEGRTLVLWLCEEAADGQDYWPKKIRIHSANPVAREYMHGMITRYGPYTWDYQNQEFVHNG